MFKETVQKYPGKINEVQIGVGDKAINLGGQNTLPFYTFDGDTGNTPKIGMEISDCVTENWIQPIKDIYKDVYENPVEWAKFVEEKFKPDFICLKLDGADPTGANKSSEECTKIAKDVVEAITIPLVIAGTGNHEKDAELFQNIAKELDGHNVLLMSAVEENYKTVAAAAGLAYNHKVGAESSVDINLAKQLNILINQLGVKDENVIANIGCATVGYGYEYVISTMDRVRLAALGQNDKTLQTPIITPVSFEVWKAKEAVEPEEDSPQWGNQEKRGVCMEISTATGVLSGGSDAIVLRHPKSVEVVRNLVNQLLA